MRPYNDGARAARYEDFAMTNATDDHPMHSASPSKDGPRGLKAWLKRGETPLARFLYRTAKGVLSFSMPVIPGVHKLLYKLSWAVYGLWTNFLRIFWYTPMFRSRVETPALRMQLSDGLPTIQGPVRIRMGSDCRVSGVITLSGRGASAETPLFEIGDNCDVGWGSTISVGTKIVFGDNVRLASEVALVGYPGHPFDPIARAKHAPCTEDQIGDIILEDDVWLGQGVMVTPNVRIGRGTVVGMGSVVTKDLPPGVLAAGAPAKVIRRIVPEEQGAAAETTI